MATSKPRTKVLPYKITGKILDWKGTFGWIEADKPVTHPDAARRGGRIYLNQADVEDEIKGPGSSVSFYLYSDDTGLGAMNCRPYQPATQKQIFKPGPTPVTSVASTPSGRQRLTIAQSPGVLREWKGAFGWIIPALPVKHDLFKGRIYVHKTDVEPSHVDLMTPGAKVLFSMYTDPQGIGADRVRVSGAPFGVVGRIQQSAGVSPTPLSVVKPKPKAAPPVKLTVPVAAPQKLTVPLVAPQRNVPKVNPNLPRERISEIQSTGEIVDWKGTYGWIMPHDTIDHPDASKRQGKIYLARKDFMGGMPHVGQLVQFHVFHDESGLGAEECSPF